MTIAQRSSKIRPKGTLEMKQIKVDRSVDTRFYTQKVIPAINNKWT